MFLVDEQKDNEVKYIRYYYTVDNKSLQTHYFKMLACIINKKYLILQKIFSDLQLASALTHIILKINQITREICQTDTYASQVIHIPIIIVNY